MNISRLVATVCRWTARSIAALVIALFVFFAIGEGMPNPLTLPPIVQVEFLALALVFGGVLVGWRWELAGGILSFASAVLFWVAFRLSGTGHAPPLFLVALALPGTLLVCSAILRRLHPRTPKN